MSYAAKSPVHSLVILDLRFSFFRTKNKIFLITNWGLDLWNMSKANDFKMLGGGLKCLTGAFNVYWSYRVARRAASDFMRQREATLFRQWELIQRVGVTFSRPSPLSPSQCLYYVIDWRHQTPLHRQQCISNSKTQGHMPSQWCHTQPQSRHKYQLCRASSFERQRAAASSFSICEMYTFNAALCCSPAMPLTQGQGCEPHCGSPIVKICAHIAF